MNPLLLERLALGELDPALAGVAADDPRVAALRGADAELCARHEGRVVRAMNAARGERRGIGGLGGLRGLRAPVFLSVAALATAVLFVVARPEEAAPARGAEPLEVGRAKGDAARLVIHRDRGGAHTRVEGAQRAAEPAAPGDLFQLAYVAGSFTHGVILSIDSSGTVTLHHPASPHASTLLARPREQRLDHALELDASPGFERFVFVSSQHPLDVDAVLAAARALGREARSAPLALPADVAQTSHVIEKATRAP